MNNEIEKSVKALIADTVLGILLIFAVIPFVTMLVWNVLVTHMFPVISIGYGGAWAVMIIRSLLFSKKSETYDDPSDNLKETLKQYAKAVFITVSTLIVGYFIGAI